MTGSFDTNISVLASAKPILTELLFSDILRKALRITQGREGVCVGALSKSVIYPGSTLGREFEELSVGERGGSCQIITQQVFSITCCMKALLQQAHLHSQIEKHTQKPTSSFHSWLHIHFSHTLTLPRRQPQSAQKLKRPSMVTQHDVLFIVDRVAFLPFKNSRSFFTNKLKNTICCLHTVSSF